MKFQEILLTYLLVCLPVTLKAQLFKGDIVANLTEIKSLDLSDDNSLGYDVMAQKIGNARIVLLGEQTHGHGTTFIAKTKVIKYLIKNKGFDIVAFESSFL